MKSKANPVRKGSIPMVLIVVVCLGILAATSIFMSSNSASLDKKSELNAAAWVLAQSAVEETLLRIANNQITLSDTDKMKYPASVTQASVKLPGLTIEDVQVFKRTLTDNASPKVKEFEELMEFIPAFLRKKAVDAAPAGAPTWTTRSGATIKKAANTNLVYNETWRRDLYENAGVGNNVYDPRIAALLLRKQKPSDTNFDEMADINFAGATAGEPKKYYDQFIASAGGAESQTATGKAVADAFDKLLPLNNAVNLITGEHSATELAAFKAQWDECGEAIANHMQNRIDGCNGDFDYAIGAMMTSFSRGAPCANDSNAGEETYREGARDSGQTEYAEALVTVSTKVNLTRGMQSASQPYSAQRLVRSMNLQPVMYRMRENLIAYFHYNYNLTYKDMLALRHGGVKGQMGAAGEEFITGAATPGTPPLGPVAGNGKAQVTAGPSQSSVPTPTVKLTTTLSDRFKDSPGTQVRNVQLATCLGELKK